MSTTRATLLHRVRDAGDAQAWSEFFELYAPLLESYARAFGCRPADAEELRDRCLLVVAERMSDFRYERSKGSFKSWLHRIARDKVVDWLRRPREERAPTEALLAVPDAHEGPDAVWEREWRAEHLRFALAEARRDAGAELAERMDLLLDDSLCAAEIGARTGWNANQVYKARASVLQRVREVLRRLGEE
jgi:RNA polymerase sigma-70 factor (ECF subfamily)